MNPKISALLNPKLTRPEFIRKKDIRGITPEFLIKRFGERAKMQKYKDGQQDCVAILINRKNQKPDVYTFENGKFVSRHVHREANGIKKYISLHAGQNGFFSKSITVTPESTTTKVNDTIITTVKKPKKGFWGAIGLNSEKFNLRMRIETENNDITKATEKIKKWAISLSNKVDWLNASDDSKQFKATVQRGIKDFNIIEYSKIDLAKDKEKLIKRAFNWLDGNFSSK